MKLIKDTDDAGRERYYNPETKRLVVVALFGAACYECTEKDGQVTGQHRGIVATDAEITEWLSGGQPKLLQVFVKSTP